MLLGREHVYDAVDGLRRVISMERREDEVPGLGRGHGGGDGLVVAHLADHDDVYVLTECCLERVMEIRRVYVHLALVNERLIGGEEIFDRVLNRDDVLGARRVDEIYHRGQGRGLA